MLWGSKLLGVVNASPLIYLGKIGELKLLKSIFAQVITTKEVKSEVLRFESAPEQVVLNEAFNSWIKTKIPKNNSLITQFEQLHIHRGEASVLVLAKEIRSQSEIIVVVIDDLAAREIARTMGFNITGTVGILLRSVKQNLLTIKQCKSLLTKLNTDTDFIMTVRIFSRILEDLEKLESRD